MPYDPVTQRWTEEDTDVTPRLTGLLSKDNAYMKQAETAGKQVANRRGLLNSTMAVTAVEDARIRSALPIAQQESAQAHDRYIQGRGLQSTDIQQQRGIESTERMQGRDITSRESLTREGYGLERELQGGEIASRERMQGADIASREGMQTADLANRQWLAQFDAQTQERLQTMDATVRQQMQQLDIDAQDRIARMNVSAAERNQAAGLAASLEQSYATLIASIMNNEAIPAASRQAYIDHANRVRDSNLALVEQMYGIDLDWGVTAQVPAGTEAQPNTPASGIAGRTGARR